MDAVDIAEEILMHKESLLSKRYRRANKEKFELKMLRDMIHTARKHSTINIPRVEFNTEKSVSLTGTQLYFL